MSAILRIAGVDEAGRGPLAGPLVVAAVVLDPTRPIEGLGDSKALTAKRRQELALLIVERALCWSRIVVEVDEIDSRNIFQATLHGMREALRALSPMAEIARIDGNRLPPELPCPAEAWIGGDARDPAIGAASILAKVYRDALLTELDVHYPVYGFARHKGYPTPEHFAALQLHGPCPAHRRSFAPVRNAYDVAKQQLLFA